MKIVLVLILVLILLVGCGEGFDVRGPSGAPYLGVEEGLDEYEPDAEMDEDTGVEIEEVMEEARHIPDDGVLRLHMRPPMTLNPLLNEDVTVARVLRLIFEPLAVISDDLRITGHLAELEFASDFSSVNATIREGAIWSDGMPVTADDVIFSIEFLRRAPNAAIYRRNVDKIAYATRIDTRTVQIVFEQASVMAGYSLNFPIIPQHHYTGQNSPRSRNNMNPLGSGPFVFESYSQMRAMSLQRNIHFRDGVQIERAEIVFLPDTETDFYAFERGRIDAIHLPLTEWTRHHGVRSPMYEIFPAMYFEFIGFNFTRSIFRSIHTRLGVAHAFNADEAVAAFYLAHAVRSATPIHPYGWAAGHVDAPVYDPHRAAALLGTVRIDAPLVVLVNEENPQRVGVAERLAESLRNAGLSTYVEAVPNDEYFARLAAHDFDLFVGGVQLPFAPDVQLFFQGGGSFVHDPILESAYNALTLASTEAAYAQAISGLQQAFVERLPIIGLSFQHSAVLTNPRIITTTNPTPDHVFVNVNEWVIGQ